MAQKKNQALSSLKVSSQEYLMYKEHSPLYALMSLSPNQVTFWTHELKDQELLSVIFNVPQPVFKVFSFPLEFLWQIFLC